MQARAFLSTLDLELDDMRGLSLWHAYVCVACNVCFIRTAMFKPNPPFLFLMSDNVYFEFPIFDMISISDEEVRRATMCS